MKCPKCGSLNAPKSVECDGCGVIFADLRRGKEQSAGPDLCSWNDHGLSCPCRGIVKLNGRWLCREHWDAHDGVEVKGCGNYRTTSVRSAWMDQWDAAWYEDWKRRRHRVLPLPLKREPGDDDELASLVPEEVGQA